MEISIPEKIFFSKVFFPFWFPHVEQKMDIGRGVQQSYFEVSTGRKG